HQRAFELRVRRAASDRLRSLCETGRLPRSGSAEIPEEGGGNVMRYGYWLPVFGGWLRNVENEGMQPTWQYVSKLARRSEQIGYSLTLIAELNLNDIKGVDAPALDAWSTAAALAAVTNELELMVAVRPTFHLPALLAKQAANIDHIGGGGPLSLNVVP